MRESARLELPLPPSMNQYWRRGPNRSPRARGGVVTHLSREGREFRREVELIWLASRDRTMFEGPVFVFAALWFPTRASDVDNRIKPTLDAMEHAGVYRNDRQVARLEFYRAGILGRKRKGLMLIEIGAYEWANETVAEFKTATGWET